MVRVKKEWFLTNSRTIFIEAKGSLNNFFLLTISKFSMLFNDQLLSTFIVIAQPFIRHLLNTYHVPGTGLNASETTMRKTLNSRVYCPVVRDMATTVKREVEDGCKRNRLDSRRQPSTLSARSQPTRLPGFRTGLPHLCSPPPPFYQFLFLASNFALLGAGLQGISV